MVKTCLEDLFLASKNYRDLQCAPSDLFDDSNSAMETPVRRGGVLPWVNINYNLVSDVVIMKKVRYALDNIILSQYRASLSPSAV